MFNLFQRAHVRGVASAVFLALMIVCAAPSARAADTGPEARYQTLLAAAKAGGPGVDWQALRFAYADRPGFSLVSETYSAIKQQAFNALDAKDFTKMQHIAQQLIDQNFVDPEAHLLAVIACKELGDKDGVLRESMIAKGLFHSIETGDGKTKQTALTVISVSEEYVYLRMKGLQPQKQSLIRDPDHGYDLLDTKDAQGQSHPVYFQIDRVLAAEMKMFQH